MNQRGVSRRALFGAALLLPAGLGGCAGFDKMSEQMSSMFTPRKTVTVLPRGERMARWIQNEGRDAMMAPEALKLMGITNEEFLSRQQVNILSAEGDVHTRLRRLVAPAFSPRSAEGNWDYKDQPPEFWGQFNTDFPPGTHIRVHPLLHWTEVDIWRYTEREKIPTIPLYFAKNGKRYRSLGDGDFTSKVFPGGWKPEYKVARPVETAGKLTDGFEFKDVADLRKHLL